MANMYLIFQTAANAVLPIVLLILLGYFLKRTGFLTDGFVKVGNKLVFKILLPCMLFVNVYSVESFADLRLDVVLFCVLMMLFLFFLGLLVAPGITPDPRKKGVMLQNAFRSNFAIIGMSLAEMLGGGEALVVCAMVAACTVPVNNALAVTALSIYMGKDGKKPDVKEILLNVLKNPLIIGIALAVVCVLIQEAQVELFGEVKFSLSRDLKFVYTAINNLKSVASPLSLVVLGGQFTFSASKSMFREIASGVVFRVVLAPAIALVSAYLLSTHTDLLHCGVSEYPALIALFGSPTAVSSAIMAGQMGNDEQLATQLVVWTSIVSILTMFVTVCILMSASLLAV